MINRFGGALLVIALVPLFVLPSSVRPEPTNRAQHAVADFADQLITIVNLIHDHYFVEIPKGTLIEWAVRGLYNRLTTEVPVEIDGPLHNLRSMKEKELRALLVQVREHVENVRMLSPDRYLDLAVEEITSHLDSQTRVVYLDSKFIDPAWLPVGVGLKLSSDPSVGMPRVVTPLLDGPAYKAGIRAGDLISQITLPEGNAGEPFEKALVISTKNLPLATILGHLTGKQGTRVLLTVQRPGMARPIEYALVRAAVKEETVLGCRRKEDDHWNYWLDADKKVAYVRLTQFKQDTGGELEEVLGALRKKNVKGLVLDLRFNTGGLLASALKVADLFIDDGLIVTIRGRGRTLLRETGKSEKSYVDFPVVCLINDESAGTSEVVAACLQDHRRAILMGERSRGNAGHQSLYRLMGNGMSLRITTAVFYRPNDKNLHRSFLAADNEWGVSPDSRYLLRLPANERQNLGDHLARQTVILPREQYRQGGHATFTDRQLGMALSFLRSHSVKP